MRQKEGNTERRRSRRYLPPRDFRLILKRPGLLSFLGPDLFGGCINVSEHGLRVRVRRELHVGETLRARLMCGSGREPKDVAVQVQYAVPAAGGCWEAGLGYADATPEVRAWVRAALVVRGTPVNRTTRRFAGDAWGAAF
jgi:hypothetical protein